jgi:hypothetical protein
MHHRRNQMIECEHIWIPYPIESSWHCKEDCELCRFCSECEMDWIEYEGDDEV